MRTPVRKQAFDIAHYGVFSVDGDGWEFLQAAAADIDCMNLVFFSTSGVHGSYATIEEAEEDGSDVTFVLFQPRLVSCSYGVVRVTKERAPFLKAVRQKSWDAAMSIGVPKSEKAV